jgi:cysteine synthase
VRSRATASRRCRRTPSRRKRSVRSRPSGPRWSCWPARGGDEAHAVDEQEARATARRLAREEGIFAGTSTGLNVAAALHYAAKLGPGHTVATVAVDTGLKYLNGDLFATG